MDYTPTIRPTALHLLGRARAAAGLLRRRRHDVLCGLALSGLALYAAAWAPAAYTQWLMRSGGRDLARRAMPADYDEVRAHPERYIGKSVRWHLMRREGQGWYYRGQPERPVLWQGPVPDINTYRHAVPVVAQILAVNSAGIRLAYYGVESAPVFIIKLPS